ncbi:MAG: GNAT family N-acetyltransferase [Planctomycetota bacterium]|jgi:GNAT superfamily N-acetyltransferase|nr:GNAT family N-acetyltransferase [Planctomycetota bacterium]
MEPKPSQPFAIFSARKEDARAIAELAAMIESDQIRAAAAGSARYAAILREFENLILARERNRYSLENILVAKVGGRAIGMVLSFPADDQLELDLHIAGHLRRRGIDAKLLAQEGIPGTYYLCDIGVLPQFRRRGIGGALFETALIRARRFGFKRASLLADRTRTGVEAFFGSMGWVQAEESEIRLMDVGYRRLVKEL